jgi:hypothetical protein
MQRAWRRMTEDDASVSTELFCCLPPFYWGEKIKFFLLSTVHKHEMFIDG